MLRVQKLQIDIIKLKVCNLAMDDAQILMAVTVTCFGGFTPFTTPLAYLLDDT